MYYFSRKIYVFPDIRVIHARIYGRITRNRVFHLSAAELLFPWKCITKQVLAIR